MNKGAVLLASLTSLLMFGCGEKEQPQVTTESDNEQVAFIAVGDMPYLPEENEMLTAPNGKIVKAVKAFFPDVVIHFGDIKSGGTACTDELLIERREQLYNLWPNRAVFTPGDNDWTDCDRKSMSPRFFELERLDFLRQHFFSHEGEKLTSKLSNLTRQPEYIENAQWQINGLHFATINVPGTNFGRDNIVMGDKQKVWDEAKRREASDIAWLDDLFAKNADSKGYVIAFQADIYQPSTKQYPVACSDDNPVKCDGYYKIRQHLAHKAAQTDKPVLVIHGDTNAYCLHQMKDATPNFWRLNGLGDFRISDAAQIVFDPNNLQQPFAVKSLLGQQELPVECEYDSKS
ncbi:MAG: hypothetical protein ACPGSN_12455 [Psychrobium sp.]